MIAYKEALRWLTMNPMTGEWSMRNNINERDSIFSETVK